MVGTGLYIEDVSQEVASMRAAVNKNIETTFFSVVVILVVTVAVIIVLTLAINLHEHRLADKNLKELAYKTVMFQEDEKNIWRASFMMASISCWSLANAI